jgi:hypothetical protein
MTHEQMRQAEDRIHRINVPVEIIHLDPSLPDAEYMKRFREGRAILDKILEETNEQTTD